MDAEPEPETETEDVMACGARCYVRTHAWPAWIEGCTARHHIPPIRSGVPCWTTLPPRPGVEAESGCAARLPTPAAATYVHNYVPPAGPLVRLPLRGSPRPTQPPTQHCPAQPNHTAPPNTTETRRDKTRQDTRQQCSTRPGGGRGKAVHGGGRYMFCYIHICLGASCCRRGWVGGGCSPVAVVPVGVVRTAASITITSITITSPAGGDDGVLLLARCSRQWTVDGGRWTVDGGRWTVDSPGWKRAGVGKEMQAFRARTEGL